MRIEIIRHQHGDVGRAGFMHHPHHRDQHQHRSEQCVEEEFIAGVNPVSTAPDADDQIHRDQAGFEHDVEKIEILRRKDADHQHLHEQEGRHIFAHALLNRVPAGTDADRHQEHRQRNQHQGNAVNTQRPGEFAEDRRIFLKLPLRAAARLVELRPQGHAQDEIDQSGDQCDPARAVRADEQTGDGPRHRHCHHQGKDGEAVHYRVIAQVAAAARPISITSA